MAKQARGLPENFELDIPDEPVRLGDFLDEEPPLPVRRPSPVAQPQARVERFLPAEQIPSQTERQRRDPAIEEIRSVRPVPRSAQPSTIRFQLNLTPKSKVQLEDLVKRIRTFSPQPDARVSEVFQAIMTLLHNAMDELELAELPKRGPWGSVTAKNFPGALSEAFEAAIFRTATKRRGV